jgi:hypothetical protein
MGTVRHAVTVTHKGTARQPAGHTSYGINIFNAIGGVFYTSKLVRII